MWVVVGLGNPGADYAGTRHNVGFHVIDGLAARAGVPLVRRRFDSAYGEGAVAGQGVTLVKPLGTMNRSGEAVRAWLGATAAGTDRLVVVHDDLDLPLGRLRIVPGGRSGGHRGVQSIQDALRTTAFARVRVGIGRPAGAGGDVVGHVLSPFGETERRAAAEAVARAVEAVEVLIGAGLPVAMNRFNVRSRGPEPEGRAPAAAEQSRGGGETDCGPTK